LQLPLGGGVDNGGQQLLTKDMLQHVQKYFKRLYEDTTLFILQKALFTGFTPCWLYASRIVYGIHCDEHRQNMKYYFNKCHKGGHVGS